MHAVKGKITFVILLCLVFFSFQVKANSLQKENSQIAYQGYLESEGKEYQQFLPSADEEMWYYTRMKGIGNVDNVSEKEEVVLITEQYKRGMEFIKRAFLLVCTKEREVLKKKELMELYNYEGGEESFQNAYPSLVFKKVWKFRPNNGLLKLVDLNKDGILDIFIELWFSGGSYGPYYIAIISFQNGELKQIFSKFAGVGADGHSPEYIDIDQDGIYEIKIPNEVIVEGFEHAASPTWIDLYEWNGKEYVLNNQKFYSKDTDILISFLHRYNDRLQWYCGQRRSGNKEEWYFEDYEFYLGLIYYYREKLYAAHAYFSRIVEKAKNENYIREAKTILKSLAETGNPDFAPRNK